MQELTREKIELIAGMTVFGIITPVPVATSAAMSAYSTRS